MLWLTFSTTSGTADLLGTWVSHTGGQARQDLQVWHTRDERELLGAGGGEEGYYVHQGPEEGGGNCHLHRHPCTRTTLEAWRARLVHSILLNWYTLLKKNNY